MNFCDYLRRRIIIRVATGHLPTAGDIEREPDDPVGDGVGRIAIEFGVPGAAPIPGVLQLELSLLFCPMES